MRNGQHCKPCQNKEGITIAGFGTDELETETDSLVISDCYFHPGITFMCASQS